MFSAIYVIYMVECISLKGGNTLYGFNHLCIAVISDKSNRGPPVGISYIPPWSLSPTVTQIYVCTAFELTRDYCRITSSLTLQLTEDERRGGWL